MRPRSLALLALAVLLLAGFLWLDRDLPGSEEREERSRHVLPDFDPEAVLALVIEPRDGEVVRLERQEAGPPEPRPRGPEAAAEQARPGAEETGWQARPRAVLDAAEEADRPEVGLEEGDGEGGEEPAGDVWEEAAGEPSGSLWCLARPQRLAGTRADVLQVDSLVSAFGRLVHERELEDVAGDEAALADLGLDAPRLRLHLDRIGDPDVELLFGADVPASSHVILAVRPADAPLTVHVVDRAILQDLQQPADAWSFETPAAPAPQDGSER